MVYCFKGLKGKNLVLLIPNVACLVNQILTSAYQKEDQTHVNRYAPTPLDHSPAAVCLDILKMDMPVRVMSFGMHTQYK